MYVCVCSCENEIKAGYDLKRKEGVPAFMGQKKGLSVLVFMTKDLNLRNNND